MLTVVADITVAVMWGMVLGAFIFIKRITETTHVSAMDESEMDLAPQDSLIGKAVPDEVLVYQLSRAFLFGTADLLENALMRLKQEPEILILGLKQVMATDVTGLNALEEFHLKLQRRGKMLLLAGAHKQPLMMMLKDGFIERLGQGNSCDNIDSALLRARELIATKKS